MVERRGSARIHAWIEGDCVRIPGSGTRRAALRARHIFHRRPKACWETSGLDYVCHVCRNRRNSSAAFSMGKDNIRGIKAPSAAARRRGGRTPPEQGRSALWQLLHIHSRKLAVPKAVEQRTNTGGPLFRQRLNALAVRARTAQKVASYSTMDCSGVDAAHRHSHKAVGKGVAGAERATFRPNAAKGRTGHFSTWAQQKERERECVHISWASKVVPRPLELI